MHEEPAETPVSREEKAQAEQLKKHGDVKEALEAIVRYIVDPKKAGRTKTDLIQKLLSRLNAAPERVGFPKSNMR